MMYIGCKFWMIEEDAHRRCEMRMIKCDRCGAIKEVSYENMELEYYAEIYHRASASEELRQIDLCDECRKAMSEALKSIMLFRIPWVDRPRFMLKLREYEEALQKIYWSGSLREAEGIAGDVLAHLREP